MSTKKQYCLTNREGLYLKPDGYMSGHPHRAQRFDTAEQARDHAKTTLEKEILPYFSVSEVVQPC